MPSLPITATTDLTPLLALNNAHATELSPLAEPRFRHLIAQARLARHLPPADALLLAFDHTADYDSPNFLWFRARYPAFLYVDRIVVASHARGRGLARQLYTEVFAQAGPLPVACEVNQLPPNPASDAFHAALGFTPAGAATHSGKTVRYLTRPSQHPLT